MEENSDIETWVEDEYHEIRELVDVDGGSNDGDRDRLLGEAPSALRRTVPGELPAYQ
jgi:hypothetical protein